MLKAGVFLPHGVAVTPEPCFVDGYEDIQGHVGGMFGVVTTDMGTFGDPDLDVTEKAQFVGFCKDEVDGDDEFNYLATALFKQPISGGVVVLWGLNDNGVTDGESYDIPDNVFPFLMEELVKFTATSYNQTMILHILTELAVGAKIRTFDEVYDLSERLANYAMAGDVPALLSCERELAEILEELRAHLPEGFPQDTLDAAINHLRKG